MTTKEDIEREIDRVVKAGEPGVWSLLAQIEDEEPKKKRRSPLWWIVVVLLAITAGYLLTSCQSIRKAKYSHAKSR